MICTNIPYGHAHTSDGNNWRGKYPRRLPISLLALSQISRWDRLKGWKSLLEAWVLLKSHVTEFCEQLSGITPNEFTLHDPDKHARMIRNAVLVLAGPEPASIVDDPEGIGCLDVR